MSVVEVTQQKIVEQERFYYDKYAFIVFLVLLLIGLSLGLAGLVILLRSTAVPPPTYFTATPLGQLINSPPLEESNIRDNVLLNWAVEAMMSAYTFNFVNYKQVINSMDRYFTKEGFSTYQGMLDHNKIIEQVVQKKMVLKAIPTDAPQILLEKPFAGRYMWKIKAPMQFTYQSIGANWSDQVDIILIVMRVPTEQSPNGVAILKLDIEHST